MASYSRFNSEDLVLSSETVSSPIWSNNSNTVSGSDLKLVNDFDKTEAGEYYGNIQLNSTSSTDVQFAIAYCDISGSGSLNINAGAPGMTPSRVNYGQYRTLVLGSEEAVFQFGSGSEAGKCFWAISIERARFKEKLRPSDFELKLASSSNITLVAESSNTEEFLDAGRKINIIESGSNSSTIYGYLLPDIGVMLLDAESVYTKVGGSNFSSVVRFSPTEPGGKDNSTNYKLFLSWINYFKLGYEETITSNYVFVRVKNAEYNYSMNPSCVDSGGTLNNSSMINNPTTFITTVGLYNDSGDLLGVAKLSKPLLKNFNREALIRVKLDY